MSNIKYILLPFLFWITSISTSSAQAQKKNKFHVELEPIQFINQGWSIVGHYAINDRWQIGSNAFSSVLSESLNNFAFDISGNIDLLAEQDFGINISIRYFLQEKDFQEGWVVSLPLGWETWTLVDNESRIAMDYTFWYLSPRIGYLWYPFKHKGFYLLGEAIAILPIITNDPAQFGESEVAVNSIIPFPSIGIGLAF